MTIAYHLKELEIAKDAGDPRNVLPEVLPRDRVILDIGCGIGQTLIALDCLDRRCVGVDIDEEAIRYGKDNFPGIEFHVADAQQVPMDDGCVDLIFTRVALPYTNIPQVVSEMQRLLRPNGRVWITLHSLGMARGFLSNAMRNRDWKDFLHKTYVVANGFIFKFTGRVLPFINGSYESWQDAAAMSRCLQKHGFTVSHTKQNGILVIEGTMDSNRQQALSPNINARQRKQRQASH